MKIMKRLIAATIVCSFLMVSMVFADTDTDYSFLDDYSLEELQQKAEVFLKGSEMTEAQKSLYGLD